MKSKPKKQTRAAEDAAVANEYGTIERTVKRWRASGAPLDDPKRLRAWLAGRKNLPPGTLEKLRVERKAQRAEAAASAQPVPSGERGAAAALARLEEAEAESHRHYQAALASGDEIQIRLAERHWSNLCAQLLKFDAQVEANRRANEMVERSTVERAMAIVGAALGVNLTAEMQKSVSTLAHNPPEKVSRILNTLASSSARAAVGYFVGTERGLPDWAVKAFVGGFESFKGTGWTPTQVETVRSLTGFFATLTTAEIEAQATGAAAEVRAASVQEREDYIAWREDRRREFRREYLRRCLRNGLPAFGLEDWERLEFPTIETLDWKNQDHVRRMDEYNPKGAQP